MSRPLLDAVVALLRPVLAARAFTPDSLPALIQAVGRLVAVPDAAPVVIPPAPVQRRPVGRPPIAAKAAAAKAQLKTSQLKAKVKAKAIAVQVTAAPAPAPVLPVPVVPTIVAPADAGGLPGPRRRGRPRKDALVAPRPMPVQVEQEAETEEQFETALLRRTEASRPAVLSPTAIPTSLMRPRDGAVPGTVRWFDPRSRTGAIRARGSSVDLTFDQSALQSSGLNTLFKGQEIEAVVVRQGNTDRVTQVRPMSATNATTEFAGLGVARRGSRKLVQVEVKRKR